MSQVELTTSYDVDAIRADFPILRQTVHGKPLVYLDNANTTQKPQSVIDATSDFYTRYNSNIHRASHLLGELATEAYEGARDKVRGFLNAGESHDVVFVRNATEGVNLVAQTFGRQNIGAGDEILVSEMEHHCNIVPWQMLCAEKGAILRTIPVDDNGDLILSAFYDSLNERTKIVGITHMSNVLGTVTPVAEIIRAAHSIGVPVLVDAAQSAYHIAIDMQALDADFLVFSGHKLYGPTGTGVLCGRKSILDAMPPYQGGGDMIATVSFAKTTYNDIPYKFEAGTPNIAGGIGLGAAIDYLTAVGLDNIAAYEHDLLEYGTQKLLSIPGLRILGTSATKASVMTFVLNDIHAQDMGTLLDMEGIAVRTGKHCAHPVLERFGVTSTVRASLGMYNTKQELDALADGILSVRSMFG
ncbi:MAG TPA: cysteine desulfurase [Capsulimonadaceae bacterium]